MGREVVEEAVIGRGLEDMQSSALARQLAAEAKRYAAAQPQDPSQGLRQQLKEPNQRL